MITITCVKEAVVDETRRIVEQSNILEKNDKKWPNRTNRQAGVSYPYWRQINEVYNFHNWVFSEAQETEDPTAFFYSVQGLKYFQFSLVNMHFSSSSHMKRTISNDLYSQISKKVMISEISLNFPSLCESSASIFEERRSPS